MKCPKGGEHEWQYGSTPNGTPERKCKKCNMEQFKTSMPVGTPPRWRTNPF